ncbi:MAG TPA: FtsQ-type POTRA domain-containing protein, partial [Syntrophales bacterium]|nr:FtsQ-type POTRA domain-containing protein [Syntrophales bacterium]
MTIFKRRARMKRSLRTKLLIRKNKLKCNSENVCLDYLQAVAMMAVIFIMTAGFIYVYNYAISSPYFVIKETSVKGCRELTEKDVMELAAIKPKQTIFSVNIKAMVRRISSNPWVENVAVSREFPNRLIVEIKERTPLASCRVNNDYYLLDKDGALFKKLTSEDDVDIPVLTGYFRDGRMNSELFNKTIGLLKHLKTSKNFPAINVVSEINASEVSGLSLFTDNGFCLKLGFDNYEGKLKRLLPVVTALNKKNIEQQF